MIQSEAFPSLRKVVGREMPLRLKPEWKEFVDDEEFWYEEGAANGYSYIDPSSKKEKGNANAWVGGYNPSSGGEVEMFVPAAFGWGVFWCPS